jgi:CRP-like cAMP-binding protein
MSGLEQRQTMLRFPNVFVGEMEGHDSPRLPDEFSPRPFTSRRPSFATGSEQPTTTDSSIAFLVAHRRNSLSSFNRAATQQRKVSLSIVEQVADTLHENMISEVVAKHEHKNRQHLSAGSTLHQRVDRHRASFAPIPPPVEMASTSHLTGDSLMIVSPRPEQPHVIQQRQDQAMYRAVAAQIQQRDERQANLYETNMKIVAATARKNFLENQRRVQRWATWMSIVSLALLQRFVDISVTHGRLVRKSRRLIVPSVFVALRRSLRRARLRLRVSKLVKPSPQELRRVDKLLALYTDDHLAWFIDRLTPKYFFDQESIIFSGLEEDEMYVLVSGSCDVMVGAKHVFTITQGMTFGTVGMLTGEPRSARIVARTQDVFVWSGRRREFESFSRGSPEATQQFQAAMTAINEMRTKNIRNVYKSMLDPSFILSRYCSTFVGISKDFIVQLTTRGLPRISRAGDVWLYTPTTVQETQHQQSPSSSTNVKRRVCGIVFRGRVRVAIPVSTIALLPLLVRQGDPGASINTQTSNGFPDVEEADAILRLLAEAMSSMIELPKQRHASGPVGANHSSVSLNASGRVKGDANLVPVASTGDGSFASSRNEFVVAAKEFVTKHYRNRSDWSDGSGFSIPHSGGTGGQQQQQQRTFIDPTNPGVLLAVVAEFSGPMLLGFPSTILPADPMLVAPASFLRVDVPAGCDAVVWEQQMIHESDMVEQLTIRQNCLNLRTPFLPQLTSSHIIHLFFQGSLAFSFLSKLQQQRATPQLVEQTKNHRHSASPLLGMPWVYPPHHALSFSESAGWELFLVLRGSITIDSDLAGTGKQSTNAVNTKTLNTRVHVDDAEHVPFLWPETHLVFFGCTPVSATTGSVPVDALRIRRCDFIAWLLGGLSEGNLRTFVPAVTEAFVSKTGRRPFWPGDGLQDSVAWTTLTTDQQHAARLLRLRQQVKALVDASVARHVLTQLHPGAVLIAQQLPHRNASSKCVGRQPSSPVLSGAGSSGFPGNARRRLEMEHSEGGSPYPPHQLSGYHAEEGSKAMSRVVIEYEQRLARARRDAQTQWKRRATSGRQLSPADRLLSPNPAEESSKPPHSVCSRNHDLGREHSANTADIPFCDHSRVTSAGRAQTTTHVERCDITPERIEELVQLRWDDDHLRRSHGVPSTYRHWRDNVFHTIPISPTSGRGSSGAPSDRCGFPRPPSATPQSLPPHRLTRQAETLAHQLDALPRPVGSASSSRLSRGSSARNTTRSVASDAPYNPDALRRRLLTELRRGDN